MNNHLRLSAPDGMEATWHWRIGQEAHDELDAEFIRMRPIAIRKAQETMEHGVSERDIYLVWAQRGGWLHRTTALGPSTGGVQPNTQSV
jgi:hypothetical protein